MSDTTPWAAILASQKKKKKIIWDISPNYHFQYLLCWWQWRQGQGPVGVLAGQIAENGVAAQAGWGEISALHSLIRSAL